MLLRTTVVVLLAAMFGACGAAPAADDLREELRTSSDQYWAAVARQDAEEVTSWWLEDAVVLGSGIHLVGRAALQEMLEGLYPALTVHNMEVLDRSIDAAGNLGIERARYREVISLGGGPQQTVDGSYLAHWRRDSEGQWRIKAMVLATAGADSLHSQ
ncbi:MAG: nuclear transport factor 2 family protein [Gemmatimonadota bacterium]